MSRMNVSQPSRSLASLHPAPSAVHLEEGTFLLFFTSCQAVVWASDTLPVVLFLSLSWRGTPLLFLVYRILMILIIAIIINIIMIAIVTVNVVITGIIIMKTCLFFIIAVFINVIINDVIVFCYIFFKINQSESVRLRQLLFPCLENLYPLFCLIFFVLSIFQLYLEEEPLSAWQDSKSILQ